MKSSGEQQKTLEELLAEMPEGSRVSFKKLFAGRWFCDLYHTWSDGKTPMAAFKAAQKKMKEKV
jgi:hypothetical protein